MNLRLCCVFSLFLFSYFSNATNCIKKTRPFISDQLKIKVNQPDGLFAKAWANINRYKLPLALNESINQLVQLQKHPKILMAAMEFGTLKLGGEKITAKSGAIGTAVSDIMHEFPQYLSNHGGGELGLVLMGMSGIPKGELKTSFDIKVGHEIHKVDLYQEELDNGAIVFVLDSEIFKRRSVNKKSKNYYFNEPELPLLSGRTEWEDAYVLSLYNHGIARTMQWWGANIYHAHNSQTLLAAHFIDPKNTVSVSIHNMQSQFRERYFTNNYGVHRDFSNGAYPFGVPIGDNAANDHLLSILGISFEEYMRIFEDGGVFNTFKLVREIQNQNGIAASPVSLQFAKRMEQRFGYHFDGINNGLGKLASPQHHPYLKQKTANEILDIHPEIKAPQVRSLWQHDLSYGLNLDTKAGVARVHYIKALLKVALLKTLDLEVNSALPLFIHYGRINKNKNLSVLLVNIRNIIDHGGQIIIAGEARDEEGEAAVAVLKGIIEKLSKVDKKRIKFVEGFSSRELDVMLQVGSDFSIFTSSKEPVGISELEFAAKGTINISHAVDGLGKVENAIMYHSDLSSDISTQAQQLMQAIDGAIGMYQNKHQEFLAMRIKTMTEKFPWQNSFKQYRENYVMSAMYKVAQSIYYECKHGDLSFPVGIEIMHSVLDLVPLNELRNLQRVLLKKQSEIRPGSQNIINIIENAIVTYRLKPSKLSGGEVSNHHLQYGAHLVDGGVDFKIWLPDATSVRLIIIKDNRSEFSTMTQDENGVWSIFKAGLTDGTKYKYQIDLGDGVITERTDPVSQFVAQGNASHLRWDQYGNNPWYSVVTKSDFAWTDQSFVIPDRPRFIEIFPGNAIPNRNDASWREIADYWLPRLLEANINFVQLMPVNHHNLHESWGYQVGSYFSTNYRNGTPDDLKYFVNLMHDNGIAVSFDLVMAHFAKDLNTGLGALGKEGAPLYEKSGIMGNHPIWGTYIFDYGKKHVREFLLSFGRMLVDEFHADGFRVDATSSILLLSFERGDNFVRANDGSDIDYYGIAFLQEFNQMMHQLNPRILAIAEEDHNFPNVTRSLEEGGLGFNYRWEVGGVFHMRDFLKTHPDGRDMNDMYKPIQWDAGNAEFAENRISFLNTHDAASDPGAYYLNQINGVDTEELKFEWARLLQGHLASLPGRSLHLMGDEARNNGAHGVDNMAGHWSPTNWPNFEATGLNSVQVEQYKKYFANIGELIQSENAFIRSDGHGAKILSIDNINKVGISLRFVESLDEDDALICITSTQNYLLKDYRIPLPIAGNWKVLFNSDDAEFGGFATELNLTPGGEYEFYFAGDKYPATLLIDLPPRTFLILKRETNHLL